MVSPFLDISEGYKEKDAEEQVIKSKTPCNKPVYQQRADSACNCFKPAAQMLFVLHFFQHLMERCKEIEGWTCELVNFHTTGVQFDDTLNTT